jgi:hypothetical protein
MRTFSGEARTKKAAEFAISLAPLVAEAREAGCKTSPEIADRFNKLGIRSASGGLGLVCRSGTWFSG